MIACRFALVIVVAFVLSVSFVVPEEDGLEAAYDNSGPTPYVRTTAFSITAPKAVVPARAKRDIVSLIPMKRLGVQGLEYGTGRAYLICDCLTILNRSLRC